MTTCHSARLFSIGGAVVEALEQRWLLSGSISTIATFSGTNGAGVLAALPDNSGNIFGVTSVSEPAPNTVGPGLVYEIPAGSSTIDVLASFGSGIQGQSMVMDSAGNLFGTTFNGGANGSGFVFEVAKGSNAITELASFPPAAHPVADQGATAVDASDDVFGIDVNGNPFELVAGSGSITTIAQSSSQLSDLELASDGNLYGTTYGGGDDSAGSIFEIPAGSSTIQTLASLDPSTTGSKPLGLAIDSSGNLFGVCENGGANGNGTIFELPAGSSTISLLATLTTSTGTTPICKPVLDSSGNLYTLAQNGGANGYGTLLSVPAGGNSAIDAADLNNAQQVGQNAASLTTAYVSDEQAREQIGIGIVCAAGGISTSTYTDVGALFFFSISAGLQGGGGSSPANVNVSSVSGDVPSSVVGGAPAKAKVDVGLQNPASSAIKGSETIKLYLSPDGQLSDATEFGSAETKTISLKSSQTKTVPITIKSFPNLAAGTYQVIAAVTDSSGNTSTAAGPSIQIAPAFVATVITGLAPTQSTVSPGKTTAVSFTLANTGNSIAKGRADAAISLSTTPEGAGTTTIATVPISANLKPGAHKTYKLKYRLPTTLSAGTVYPAIDLAVSSLGDITASDGLAISTTSFAVS